MVYQALCQSILSYCITVWGGTSKITMLQLERAQRAVLKVSHGLPFLYPTKDLYSLTDVLSVRQLFVLNNVLKQHSLIKFDPALNANKRLKHKVCRPIKWATAYSNKFFGCLGSYLYNKVNEINNIYPLTKYQCKRIITSWLKSLDYDQTEKLLIVPS
jgi:hypothetical protein